MGAKEGVGVLFGPAGYVVGVAEDMTKDSSVQARALTATLLAQGQDQEIVDDLLDALSDKNLLVRVAAAKALGGLPLRLMLISAPCCFSRSVYSCEAYCTPRSE
jgi:HEAT repeats